MVFDSDIKMDVTETGCNDSW